MRNTNHQEFGAFGSSVYLGVKADDSELPMVPKEANRMKSASIVASAVASLLFAAMTFAPGLSLRAAETADPLDGKTFVGEIGEKGKKEGQYEEKMSFKDGEMVSSACSSLGFARFPYTATQKGDVVEFVAEATNPTEGTLRWAGVVKGDSLNATSVWTKAGSPPEESWLTAKQQD